MGCFTANFFHADDLTPIDAFCLTLPPPVYFYQRGFLSINTYGRRHGASKAQGNGCIEYCTVSSEPHHWSCWHRLHQFKSVSKFVLIKYNQTCTCNLKTLNLSSADAFTSGQDTRPGIAPGAAPHVRNKIFVKIYPSWPLTRMTIR